MYLPRVSQVAEAVADGRHEEYYESEEECYDCDCDCHGCEHDEEVEEEEDPGPPRSTVLDDPERLVSFITMTNPSSVLAGAEGKESAHRSRRINTAFHLHLILRHPLCPSRIYHMPKSTSRLS